MVGLIFKTQYPNQPTAFGSINAIFRRPFFNIENNIRLHALSFDVC